MGGYFTWNLNKQTRLRIAAGYQHQSFDSYETNDFSFFGPPIITVDNAETNQPYYSISLSQQLSDRTSHELSAGYETNLNRRSENLSAHFINYGITQSLWKGSCLTASAFFEYAETEARFQLTEITTMGADLLLTQNLTEKIFFTMGYSYVDSRSRITINDVFFGPDSFIDEFKQHITGVSLAYAISAKTQAQLSWQGFYNDAKYLSDQDHHRVSLTLRMQF